MSARVYEFTAEPWLTKAALAERLGCSERWLEYQMDKGMPAWRIAGRVKFRASEAEAWLVGRGEIEAIA